MSLVSVILPTCDRPDLLPRALRSVLDQSGVSLEVLLVDSNRTTGPVSENPALGDMLKDPRVSVVVPQRRPTNASEARNAGLDAAQGAWISYLDDDDAYLPGKLARQLACAEQRGADLVICGYEVVMRRRRRVRQCHQSEFCGDACLVGADYPTPVMFHRADPDVRFETTAIAAQDHLFAIAFLARRGERRVVCVPEKLLVMHTHEGPRVNSGNRLAVWHEYRACLQKHGHLFSREARRAFLATGLLARAQALEVSWPEYIRCLRRIRATQGWGSWRLMVNAVARRSNWLSRWVVN